MASAPRHFTTTTRTFRAVMIATAVAVTLAASLAIALACAPAARAGDAPSAIDQYLEVVPGPEGSQSPEEFSRSLGGDGGPVTREQVIRAARINAAARAREAAQDRLSPDSGIAYSSGEDAPSTLAAFTNAATGGSVGTGLGLPLLALMLLTAALALVLRRRQTA